MPEAQKFTTDWQFINQTFFIVATCFCTKLVATSYLMTADISPGHTAHSVNMRFETLHECRVWENKRSVFSEAQSPNGDNISRS